MTPRIAWLTYGRDMRMASTRIRASLVMRALQQKGLAVEWYDPSHHSTYDVVVSCKRYDEMAWQVADKILSAGKRFILDLCDNRFEYPEDNLVLAQQAQSLKALCQKASNVVVSTASLGDCVKEHVGDLAITVIGDFTDDLSVIPRDSWSQLSSTFKANGLIRSVRRLQNQGYRSLIWFGNHGGAYADGGMQDLCNIRDALENAHSIYPLSLTVISNHREKFKHYIAPFDLPTFYADWSPSVFNRLLQMHHICIIPSNLNPFTRCKSDNRVVSALLHGLQVLADPVPSYKDWQEWIGMGDWDAMLAKTLAGADIEKVKRMENVSRLQLSREADCVSGWCTVLLKS